MNPPTQKPVGILRRIIAASSRRNDWVLDFFGGSGTTGAAALELELQLQLQLQLERRFLLVDQNPEAITTMQRRFADADVNFVDA